jgi:hypothetical protein
MHSKSQSFKLKRLRFATKTILLLKQLTRKIGLYIDNLTLYLVRKILKLRELIF